MPFTFTKTINMDSISNAIGYVKNQLSSGFGNYGKVDDYNNPYGLILTQLHRLQANLLEDVDVAKPSESNFTSHHAKLLSIHNSLFADPWDDTSVYLCDKKWNVVKISNSGRLETRDGLCQLPDACTLCANPSRFHVSLVFPSPTLAVATNGVDALYILETGDRTTNVKWKIVHKNPMETPGEAIQLLDAVFHSQGETIHLECLVAFVEDVEGETKEKHRSPYISVIEWVTFASVDGKSWGEERTRRLEGASPIQCAYLDSKAQSVHIVSQKAFSMTKDSVKPVESGEEWDVVGDEVCPTKLYTWSQTDYEVAVQITIPEGVTKAGLNVTIGPVHLEIGVKNGVDMIKGDLFRSVEVDSSTWTLEGRRLEVTLAKIEDEMWENLVFGDNRGELVLTSEQIEAIHQRLEHLTSEHWNENPELLNNKPFNAQMLEDCDAVEGDGNLIMRIDGETHRMSHKVIASQQFLFSTRLGPDASPALCLRHDVDGFLWQAGETVVDDGSSPWKHTGVLNAFGYVLASKQQQRFVTCSPDMSVAVIADSNRHIYLYRQKVSVLSPLRNRKTGQQVSSVAKQQVIALDCSPDAIVGIRATNTKLFIATERQVLMYVMNVEE